MTITSGKNRQTEEEVRTGGGAERARVVTQYGVPAYAYPQCSVLCARSSKS